MSESVLVEMYRESLERLERVAAQHLGHKPRLLQAPASSAALAQAARDLGHDLPSELVALYRVTNGISAFSFDIEPVERLAQARDVALEDYDDIEGQGLSWRIWGPRPQGETLVLATGHELLLLELDGPGAGRLTLFDVSNDFGYRFAAPSIAAMLDAWAVIAEAGLVQVSEARNGDTDIDAQTLRRGEVAELLADHAAMPEAAWILTTEPPG